MLGLYTFLRYNIGSGFIQVLSRSWSPCRVVAHLLFDYLLVLETCRRFILKYFSGITNSLLQQRYITLMKMIHALFSVLYSTNARFQNCLPWTIPEDHKIRKIIL